MDIMKIDNDTRVRIRESDDSFEKKINEVLLFNLSRKMIKEDVPSEFAAGFKAALLIRSSIKSLDSKWVLTNE